VKKEFEMNSSSREKIFHRLRTAGSLAAAPDKKPMSAMPIPKLTGEEKVERLKTLMEAIRTEVYLTKSDNWIEKLESIAKEKKLTNLLIAPETDYGKSLQDAWQNSDKKQPVLLTYDGEIEDFKSKLFEVDAALTTTIGGIADPGAIILWPNEIEPRLMSLVPHIHIAILEAEKIYASPAEAFSKLKWSEKIPTNALLISGPSKTADIEFILVFGVHGPKELILLIIE
jgi:L-lactate dehydrogenase complex protein LldG